MSLDYPETNKFLIQREIKCERVSEFVKQFNIPFSQIFANQKVSQVSYEFVQAVYLYYFYTT